MKILGVDEILQPGPQALLPEFKTSSVSECLSPGSDSFTSPLKDMSKLLEELLPRPQMFPAEECLTPGADVLLPPFEQPTIEEVLYPKAEDLLPLVDKLLPPSEELMPRPDLRAKDSSRQAR
jgi:hypothetical protein